MGELKLGSFRVKIGKVRPNAWNPNAMDDLFYQKLKTGLELSLREGQDIPPIIVRPHPKGRYYEIIDGFHRHAALVELGQERINVFSIDVPDKQARILTNTLNYLRGRPDRKKMGQGIVELLELGATTYELAQFLPETQDDLQQLLEESEVSLEALSALHGEKGEDDDLEGIDKHQDDWVDLKFRVSVEQAEVIMAEVDRVAGQIKGKNLKGRALEYMAVQSSQTAGVDE